MNFECAKCRKILIVPPWKQGYDIESYLLKEGWGFYMGYGYLCEECAYEVLNEEEDYDD